MPTPSDHHLGPYRLVREIGRGAIGVVHLAVDSRSGQPVALKSIDLGDDLDAADRRQLRERFLGEAQAARRLSHPDIVAVLDAGEQQGRAWLAMELLAGCELGRYTRRPRLLPEALVLQLAERLAGALAHAHGRGVVHRDIKPGNVMLDLASGQLKLTDFGLARLADHSRTRTGVVLGSPWYMAPEQLAGAEADARSDLYSLGVLLFQLLSGRLPHEHSSLGELLRAVAREPAPGLRSLRPELPEPLEALVARLLQPQPARRPADAAALACELAALRPALAAPPLPAASACGA